MSGGGGGNFKQKKANWVARVIYGRQVDFGKRRMGQKLFQEGIIGDLHLLEGVPASRHLRKRKKNREISIWKQKA